MVSLAGIPPFAGSWGKFFIFKAAIERGDAGAMARGRHGGQLGHLARLLHRAGPADVLVSDEGARPFRPPALVAAVVGWARRPSWL